MAVMGRRTRAAAHLARAVHEASAPGSPSLWQRLRAVPRMVRAVRSGEYAGLTSSKLALLLAGVGYVVSPIDLAPEGLLLVLGLADDAVVLGWVAITLVRETEDFLAWERERAAGWAHTGGGSAHASPGAGGPQTVPSHVVR